MESPAPTLASRTAPWQLAMDHAEWDADLARASGHPLQSMLWAEARRQCDGIEFQCFHQLADGARIAMARVERRNIPLLGSVAWIPRGPLCTDEHGLGDFSTLLKRQGFHLWAGSPYRQAESSQSPGQTRTIWIDLSVGEAALQANLDSQWRYGARRALREGVSIAESENDGEISAFYSICSQISETKGFRLPGSLSLMRQLLHLSSPDAPVRAHLLLAKYKQEVVAGAFVLVVGRHLHYMWGGVDRRFSKLRAGEAIQWGVIEWALKHGLVRYDLEGIDPLRNPGTYEFKKKMGGTEIVLAPQRVVPLDWRGNVACWALALREKWGNRL